MALTATERELLQEAFQMAAKELGASYLSPAIAVFQVDTANSHTDMIVHVGADGMLEVRTFCVVHVSDGWDEDRVKTKVSERLGEIRERWAACAREMVNEAIAREEEHEDGFYDE